MKWFYIFLVYTACTCPFAAHNFALCCHIYPHYWDVLLFGGVGFINWPSAFGCCLWEMKLDSSVGSFFSIPLASILLVSKLRAFATKLSWVIVSSRNAYHYNRLERQFWMTADFICFAPLPNSQVAASFHNLMINWSMISFDCWTAWWNWNTW